MYNQNLLRRPIHYGPKYNSNDNRFVGGGFAVPFLLGGITGGLLAPAFNRPYYGYPNYGYPIYPVYPRPYPIYY